MSDSLQPYGLWLISLLCSWDFPGKNTGVGLPFPPPGDLPDTRIEPVLHLSPEFQAYSLLLEPSGKTKREFIPQEKGFYVLNSNQFKGGL